MTNPQYINLTRQSALLNEIDMIATNIANMNTTGYRREATIFSEYIIPTDGATGSVSMTATRARYVSPEAGPITQTNGTFDFAINGDAFFLIQTANGERLTRAGSFSTNGASELVTPDGHHVLDAGGAPIFIPPDQPVSVSPDGAIVTAEGDEIGRIALVRPLESTISREAGTLLVPNGELVAAEDATLAQGYLESSNVNAVGEITRMIEVHRAYELGQTLAQGENERLDRMMQTLARPL